MSHSPALAWTTTTFDEAAVVPQRRAFGRGLVTQLLIAMGREAGAIDVEASGKPILRGPSAPHISIAHTGGVIAVAVSTVGPVGLDIEYRDADRDLNRLAGAAFGAAECRAVAVDGVSAFYRIWTVREAMSKATGEGMTRVADGIDRVPAGLVDGLLVAAGEGWLLGHGIVEPDLSLALAVRVQDGRTGLVLPPASLADLRLDISG